jgi:preprotein translocase subunit SecE
MVVLDNQLLMSEGKIPTDILAFFRASLSSWTSEQCEVHLVFSYVRPCVTIHLEFRSNYAITKASLNIISELQKVTWPTRQETMKLTIVVVVGSLFVGLYIGGLDIIFAQMLRLITK